MSPLSLLRLSGFALVLAATMFVIAEMIAFSIIVEHGEEYDLQQIATTSAFFLQSLLMLVAGAFLLGGLVGLYVRQSEAAGKLGLVGFLLAFFGTALLEGNFYANTFVTPMVVLEASRFLDDPLSGMLQAWLPFSFGLLAFSWLVLAVATVWARVYPRAASWVLLLGALVALVPFPLDNLLSDAAVAWLGLVLLRAKAGDVRRRRRSKSRR